MFRWPALRFFFLLPSLSSSTTARASFKLLFFYSRPDPSEGRLLIVVEAADEREVALDLPGKSSENEFFLSVVSSHLRPSSSSLTHCHQQNLALRPVSVAEFGEEEPEELVRRQNVPGFSCFHSFSTLNLHQSQNFLRYKHNGCPATETRYS